MYLLLAIHIAWTLGAVPLVTRQKRLPASAAAWLALILLLPVAGTLLYVLAGYRPHLPADKHYGRCILRQKPIIQAVFYLR